MVVEREAVGVTVTGLVEAAADGQSGALWRLRHKGRQLDANLVRLLPGGQIAVHREPEVDVLLTVVQGGGSLTLDGAEVDVVPGSLTLLPRGSARSLRAGPEGLVFLTAHRRRAGMAIGRPPRTEPRTPQCPLHLVCEQCHRHAIEADARYCSWCGTRLVPRATTG
ncbi:cupin domain-containing protein [Streptomyces xanthophaeus]|nr:cupin domain-containing protein [Streptomyces xanthophaeus]